MRTRYFAALFAAALSGLCSAQVDWATTIEAPVLPVVLTQRSMAPAAGGGFYMSASGDVGDFVRMRVSKIGADGKLLWNRLIEGSALQASPIIGHADGSVTVPFARWNNVCIENLSSQGDSRAKFCLSSADAWTARVARAEDDDIYLAHGQLRTVRKYSTSGLLRWQRDGGFDGHSSGAPTASGVDSNGNYFQFDSGRLYVWRSWDGYRSVSPTLAHVVSPLGTLLRTNAVPRNDGDIAVVVANSFVPGATTVTVVRYTTEGVLKWTQDLQFTSYEAPQLAVSAAADDGVYVVSSAQRTGGVSSVVRLDASGAVVWRRDYSDTYRVIPSADQLLAVRISASATSSTSVVPIAASDGALGIAQTYLRPDAVFPTVWESVGTDAVAWFDDSFSTVNSPLVPFGALTVLFARSNPVPVEFAMQDRYASKLVYACASENQSFGSSESGWWVQAQTYEPDRSIGWYRLNTMGQLIGRYLQESAQCGFPFASDESRYSVSADLNRVRRINADGSKRWVAKSNMIPEQHNGSAPITRVNGSSLTYAVGSIVGRATDDGQIAFEFESGLQQVTDFVVAAAGDVWAVGNQPALGSVLLRISSSGALQWSTPIDLCGGSSISTVTATNSIYAVSANCDQTSKITKIDAEGNVLWRRVISPPQIGLYYRITSVTLDAADGLLLGGCRVSQYSAQALDVNDTAFIGSWSADGVERWVTTANLIGGSTECVYSIAIDADGHINSLVASSGSGPASNAVIWALRDSGAERWRWRLPEGGPAFVGGNLRVDAQRKLFVSGGIAASREGTAQLRALQFSLALQESSRRVGFLQLPATAIGARDLFNVTVGLFDEAGLPAVAQRAMPVSLSLATGFGTLSGSLQCIIATGSSSCTISGIQYDRAESGVVLTASAGGFPTTASAALTFTRATTTTVVSAVSTTPFAAFSNVRVRASVNASVPKTAWPLSGDSPAPVGTLQLRSNPFGGNRDICRTVEIVGALMSAECEVFAVSRGNPIVAHYWAGSGSGYDDSTAVPLTLPLTRLPSSLSVAADLTNTYVVGDRVRFRVAVLTDSGLNASTFLATTDLDIQGYACENAIAIGNIESKFAGSYRICDFSNPGPGTHTLSINFSGSADLLPADSINVVINIVDGAVVRGDRGSLPAGATMCTTSPAVNCSISDASRGEWQCVGPVGTEASVFFVPQSGSDYYFPGTPLRFPGTYGALRLTTPLTSWASSGCSLDLDGDGARFALTDGLVLLRRMLGLTGAPLVMGTAHDCAPRTAAEVVTRINLGRYDIDGDGRVGADTDGLLLLRSLLGFRGRSLIAGAIGATAIRRSASEIESFLDSSCDVR